MFNAVNYALAKRRWVKAGEDIEVFGNAGRNLIVGSDTPSHVSNRNTTISYVDDGEYKNVLKSETTVIGDFTFFTAFYNNVSMEPPIGSRATLSLLVRGVVADGYVNNMNIYYNTGTNNKNMVGIEPTYKWLSVTFDVGSDATRFHFYPSHFHELYVARAKLEIGGTSTHWTPAPEDTDMHPLISDISESSYQSKRTELELSEIRNAIISLGGAI